MKITKENQTAVFIEIVSEFQSGETSRVEISKGNEAHVLIFLKTEMMSMEIIKAINEYGRLEETTKYYFNLPDIHRSAKWTARIKKLCVEGSEVKGINLR